MTDYGEILNGLCGHEAFRRQAQAWHTSGQFPPAVLFHGAPGLGKTTAAEMLARLMLGDFFDPVNYTKSNGSDERGIDYIRGELKRLSLTAPLGAKRRAIFLDEAGGLTPAAQDAMRQIMEEGAENALFILTANDLSKIRPAIRSRCMVFEFVPPSIEEVNEWALFNHGVVHDYTASLYAYHGKDLRKFVRDVELMQPDDIREMLAKGGEDSNASLSAIGGEWMELRSALYRSLDNGRPLNTVMNGFLNSLTEFFDMDADRTFDIMAVLGDMLPVMFEWRLSSYSFVDCLVARLRKEVAV